MEWASPNQALATALDVRVTHDDLLDGIALLDVVNVGE
jgi:hypothetical protein